MSVLTSLSGERNEMSVLTSLDFPGSLVQLVEDIMAQEVGGMRV